MTLRVELLYRKLLLNLFYKAFFLFLSRIFLAGQSAGAHLATCALLKQAVKQVTEDPAKLSWRSSQINGYLAISGG